MFLSSMLFFKEKSFLQPFPSLVSLNFAFAYLLPRTEASNTGEGSPFTLE